MITKGRPNAGRQATGVCCLHSAQGATFPGFIPALVADATVGPHTGTICEPSVATINCKLSIASRQSYVCEDRPEINRRVHYTPPGRNGVPAD